MALILLFALYIILVMAMAIRMPMSHMSRSELARRAARGDSAARREYDRHALRPYLLSLQRLIILLIVIVLATWAAWTLGWLQGGIVALAAVLTCAHVARIPVVARMAQRWYAASEPVIHDFIGRHDVMMRLVGIHESTRDYQVASRDELLELIEQARAEDISPRLKRHLAHTIAFENKSVARVMTSADEVVTVNDDETLGPLVLDGLYKTGHGRFPVRDHMSRRVIGILSIDDLLTIRHHETAVVRDVMERDVATVKAGDMLVRALRICTRTRHHMLIVVDAQDEMVGIVTLEALLEAMLGERLTQVD